VDKPKHALLIEDDIDICELLRIILRSESFQVDIAHDGLEGLRLARAHAYNIIILDLMLPELDGWEVCRQLRSDSSTRSIPIIMLTAKGEESDKVLGLELGADDYITKPFRPREFLARVRALLRRSHDYNRPPRVLKFARLSIDSGGYSVRLQGREINLTPKEFELLLALAHNEGQILSREQLLERVWGFDYTGGTRTIDEHVKRIRQKFSAVDSKCTYIQTVWGVGYKFEVKENVP